MKRKGKQNKIEPKSLFLSRLEEQKNALDKLKESEQFNRLLFEQSPIGLAIICLDGAHIDVNRAYEKILGRKLAEILKISVFDVTPPQYHKPEKKYFKMIAKTGYYGPYEKELIQKNGKIIIVKVFGVLVKRNEEEEIFLNVENITHYKANEDLIKERETQFRSLYENTFIGFYRTTPDGKIIMANPTFIKMLGCSSFKECSKLNLEGRNYKPSYKREDYKKQIEKNNEIKGWEDTWKRKDGSVIHIRESARTIRDNKGKVLYYEGTVEDISDSKKTLQALQDSQEIYKTIFATVNDAIFISGIDDGKIFTSNEKLSGFTNDEMIGKTVYELNLWVNPADRLRLIELSKLYGSVSDQEVQLRRKDGSVFTGSFSLSPIVIQGKKYMLSVIRDITERQKSIEQLAQSEKKFRSVFYTSPDSININRFSDGLYLSVNEGFTEATGYTEEDVKGKTSSDLNIWADDKARERLIAGLNQYGKYENLETRFRKKDGAYTYGLMSATLIDINGEECILSVTRDITERKKAEQRQWELQEELRTTLYSIGDAVISTDRNGRVRQMNPVAEQLTGWSEAEAAGKPLMEIFRIICEDNRKEVESPVERVLKEGIIVGLANHTLLISKDGAEHPIADSGAPIRDKDGNIIGVVLVFRDQTDERISQETLRKNEERMRAIVEGTPNLFFYTQDANANTTYVSPTVELITGYTPEKWMKEKSWFLTDSDINKDAIRKTQSHLKGDFSERSGYLEIKHASGFPIILEVYEYPVMKDGKVKGLQGVAHNITRRKQAENELQKTNETLFTIIQSSPLAIIALDMEGIVTVWNPAAERIYGWTREEAVGKPKRTIPDFDKESNLELLERISRNPFTHYDCKRKKKDGSIIDVSISAVLLYDFSGKENGILTMQMDITSRKRYEENLKKLYQATEQSPVSIVITDFNGDIEYVNPHLTAVSGYTFNEVVGKNPRIFKSGVKSYEEYKELWDTILNGKQWRGEFINKKKDNSIYCESASISPIRNDEGKITHFIAVKEDITDKKKIIEELIVAKNIAEEANRTKDLFLANMSHELRTPLIGILGYSDLLTEIINDEETSEMARGIQRSGKRLLNTLNMILNFSKIESEKYEIVLKPINVINELELLYKTFLGAAKEKHLDFALKIQETGLIINADPSFFTVVLENLINNAIKFTLSGSIVIEASKENNDTFLLTVKDTGIGIKEEYFESIFMEFRQVSEGINREFQGTGLGLSIAKKYVEMMKGSIKVESVFGKGSTFILRFPLYKETVY